MRKDFNYIVKEAISDTGLNIHDKLSFHYFNKNGLISEWNKACDRIRVLVDAARVPTGWHLAYGSLNSYHADALRNLYNKKRVSGTMLESVLRCLVTSIDRVNAKVDEKTLEIINEGAEVRLEVRQAKWDAESEARTNFFCRSEERL